MKEKQDGLAWRMSESKTNKNGIRKKTAVKGNTGISSGEQVELEGNGLNVPREKWNRGNPRISCNGHSLGKVQINENTSTASLPLMNPQATQCKN